MTDEMRVFIRQEKSDIHNDDIRWYLADEALWVTHYENYVDIEKNIGYSWGSINWLYEINDTLLFERTDGRFNSAVIDLSQKINVTENAPPFKIQEKEGNLYLVEKKFLNFEFSRKAYYAFKEDYLYSCKERFLLHKDVTKLSITTDFHFFVCKNELVGWGLKNASRHLQVSGMQNQEINEHTKEWLAMYLKALKSWEEDESKVDMLVNLYEKVRGYNDVTSLAIKESLNYILQ